MSSVLIYGSGECEQLGLGDDAPPEVKKPRAIPTFSAPIKVHQLAWGGMHTLALTTDGRVYSWGCNDEAALGREGAENVPLQVDSSLEFPMTNVVAGDWHSIAYNTSLNVIYRWGLYRNALSGKIGQEQKTPIRIDEEALRGLKLKKVTSGSHHTLVLASGRVFGWGDPETGKTGRMLKSRNKNNQSLIIEAIGLKNVLDIFCGSDTSYAINESKNETKHVYSWGLNNWGQLGIGHRENMSTPTEIKAFKGIDIKQIWGGAHHAIALTTKGEVYSWGKNEEGQLGIGDTYSEFATKQREELVKLDEEERKINEELHKQFEEAKNKGDKGELKKLTATQKKSKKKYEKLREDDANLENILYSTIPKKIEGLSNIFFIASGATYNYAIERWNKEIIQNLSQDDKMIIDEQNEDLPPNELIQDASNDWAPVVEVNNDEKLQDANENKEADNTKENQDVKMEDVKPSQDLKIDETKENQQADAHQSVQAAISSNVEESKLTESKVNVVYSWGINNSYVLWTKDEETRYTPYLIDPSMYKGLCPLSMSWGTLHVVVRARTISEKDEDFELDPKVHEAQPKLLEEMQKAEPKLGKKRKLNEVESDQAEGKNIFKHFYIVSFRI